MDYKIDTRILNIAKVRMRRRKRNFHETTEVSSVLKTLWNNANAWVGYFLDIYNKIFNCDCHNTEYFNLEHCFLLHAYKIIHFLIQF